MNRTPKAKAKILRASVLVALALSVVILAVPAAATAAYSPWAAQTSGTTRPLYGVAFTSGTSGWAVGGSGVILHTTDGATWKPQTSKTTQSLYGVAFADASNGWAVGGSGVILHTTNGGGAWSAQTSGTTQNLEAVRFVNVTTGWAVGGRGTVLRTTNGGATWTTVISGTTQTLYGLAAADATTLWVVGNKGTVMRSTNGGVTWTGLSAGTRTTVYAVGCSGATTAWIGGNGGFLRKTTDGSTWPTTQDPKTNQALRAFAVTDAGNIRLAGGGGVSRVTTNGGSTWTTEVTPSTQTLYGIAWRGTRGWLVGGGGTILGYLPDTTAPQTMAAGLQADGVSGWANKAVAVTLTATDTGRAGVASTYYTVDGGARMTYSAAFSISGPGSHLVSYWSVDAAGNAESPKTGYVNIDTAAPTLSSNADALWHATDVTVHLTAADTGGSGVAATQYRTVGASDWITAAGGDFVVAATSGQGLHKYEFQALDRAGNASAAGACTVRIDATPAVTTATGLGADKLSGWTTDARTVTLVADDGPGSGPDAIHYTVDDQSEQTYTKAFTVSGVGQHPVTYWSVDKTGNIEAAHTGWVNISDPFAQAENLAPDTHSQWHNAAVTVTITGHSIAGTPTIRYVLDGGAQQEAASPLTLQFSTPGHHKVDFWAEINGGKSPDQTGYVNIDTTAPQTTAQVSTARAWVNKAATLVFIPQDDSSGVVSTFSTLDDLAQQEGTLREVPAPADHSGDGPHTVKYWSTDAAGNSGVPGTTVIRIDTRRPTTKAPYAASVYRYRTAKLRFVVADTAPCAGTASAKIVVKNRRGRIAWQSKTLKVTTGVTATAKFRCKLAKGTYKFYVYATDPAGNVQSKAAYNKLIVR